MLDPITSARATVVAGRPPAILKAQLVKRIAPVVPKEVLVKPGIEMIPREDFVFFSMPVGEELNRQPTIGHRSVPFFDVEVLAPFLERAAFAPYLFNNRSKTAIASGQHASDA